MKDLRSQVLEEFEEAQHLGKPLVSPYVFIAAYRRKEKARYKAHLRGVDAVLRRRRHKKVTSGLPVGVFKILVTMGPGGIQRSVSRSSCDRCGKFSPSKMAAKLCCPPKVWRAGAWRRR